MKSRLIITVAVLLICGVANVRAAEVIDQSQEGAVGGTIMPCNQTFQPSYNNVSAISVRIATAGVMTIRLKNARCGSELAIGTVTGIANEWVKVTFASPVSVTPEAVYDFETSGPAVLMTGSNPYTRGTLHGCPLPNISSDAQFRTYSEILAVPNEAQTWGEVKARYLNPID